jgi:hypothetical protein
LNDRTIGQHRQLEASSVIRNVRLSWALFLPRAAEHGLGDVARVAPRDCPDQEAEDQRRADDDPETARG